MGIKLSTWDYGKEINATVEQAVGDRIVPGPYMVNDSFEDLSYKVRELTDIVSSLTQFIVDNIDVNDTKKIEFLSKLLPAYDVEED